MNKSSAFEWSRAFFAVLGAFVFSGTVAGIGSGMLGYWEVPVAGCFAAFSVVLAAYSFAPSWKRLAAAAVFCVGALAAWKLIGRSSFPQSYGELAYQPTSIPFAATLAGGLVALVGTWLLEWRRQQSGKAPNNSSKPTPLRGAA
jgi:hypothetical protein